jgi:hypothetical protein
MVPAMIEQRLAAFFADRPGEVAAVYLFGSAARGDAGPSSDLDIGVLFRIPPEPTFAGQPCALEGALERCLGGDVDLVALNTAPVDLRIRVLREGRLVFERDRSARIQFEVRTRNEAFDLEPILHLYRAVRRVSA